MAALGAGLAGMLGLGLYLTPSTTGAGTHEQLGLPPCGMLLATGHPCPTCGVTTAFALAAHGHLAESLVTQPLGLVLFLGVLGGLVLSVASVSVGRSWFGLVTVRRFYFVIIALTVIALVSWGYKWSVI
jgi:hypothetical protein